MAYCVRADIESRFGPLNVAAWADLDNDGDATKITARIAWAIADADAEIDDRLRGGLYRVPIVGMDQVPKTIVGLSAMWAAVLLYNSRGIQDFDPNTGLPVHRLSWFVRRFDLLINDILSGRRRLDAVLTVTSTVPVVVPDEDS